VLYTNWAPRQGFGHDMRFYAHILPALAILSAGTLAPVLEGVRARRVGVAALAIFAVMVAATAIPSHLGLRGYYFGLAATTLASLGFLHFTHRLQWQRIDVKPWLTGACLALPALWTAYYLGDLPWFPEPPAARFFE
jgi:hypothetical protein